MKVDIALNKETEIKNEYTMNRIPYPLDIK